LDQKSGGEIWSLKNVGNMDPQETRAVIDDGTLYFSANAREICAVDLKSHKEKWRTNLGQKITGIPSPTGGHVLVTTDKVHTVALSKEDGKLAWQVPLDFLPENMTACGNAMIYAGDSYQVSAISRGDGRKLWSWSAPKAYREEHRCRPKMSVAGQYIYVSFYDGRVYKFACEQGDISWSLDYAYDIIEHNTYWQAGKDLFVIDYTDVLNSIDPETHRVIWRHRSGDYGVASFPIVDESRVYY
jgi:outer membrane protein assembly factor BamB